VLKVKTLVVGDLSANCYILSSSSEVERNFECIIIDPGDEADFITQTIIENKLKPAAIVLTHGHFDHVLGCLELKLNFSVPILINQRDQKIYSSANQSAKHWIGKSSLKVPPIDQFIKEGDQIKVGTGKLTVIETPGHTPGSICLYHEVAPRTVARKDSSEVGRSESSLFTGDTLFAQGVGRTDFSYSQPLQLIKSLKKLFRLPPETVIYPGHGESTTMSLLVSTTIP